ncbi:MAG: hypothetical protein HRU06_10645 [Oceanospirillaceae bacterium]|nr:hypothetical protein [Oceanospirillaceae bacterium]
MESMSTSNTRKPFDFNKILVTFLLFSCPVFNTFAKPDIKWAKYQLPPVFINQGEFRNKGMGDAIFSFLQTRLSNYSHTDYLSVGVRIMRDFKLKPLVCSAMTSKKGREDFMIFSHPVTVLPSHNLHFSAKNPKLQFILEESRINGVISFERLLASSANLIIGLNIHRSFGDKLNDILKLYIQQVQNLDETTSTADLLYMIDSQRIDLTIELPFISYFVSRSANITVPIAIEPLAEASKFVKAYIACSNNAAGNLVINKINQIIIEERSSREYQQLFENWIPPQSRPSFRAGFKRHVIEAL